MVERVCATGRRDEVESAYFEERADDGENDDGKHRHDDAVMPLASLLSYF